MTAGNKLSLVDQAFLMMESADTPAHVGALQIFRLPEGNAAEYFSDLVEKIHDQPAGIPNSLMLEGGRFRPGRSRWQETEIDPDYHFRRLALPSPGSREQLLELVARLHSRPLDRRYPLWEVYLIEIPGSDRFALYSKIHHACTDGMATVALLERIFSTSPDDRNPVAPWNSGREVRKKKRRQKPALTASLRLRRGGRLLRDLTGWSRDFLINYLRDRDLVAAPYDAPHTLMNGPVSPRRTMALCSLDLTDIRKVCRKEGVTVNDVVLSVCGGALRSYLESRKNLPEKSLVASLPVSLRFDEGRGGGNQVSFLMCRLATDEKDPVKRLHRISASVQEAKNRLQPMSRESAMVITLAADGMHLTTGPLSRISDRTPPLTNLVISNMTGTGETLYWNGARMEGTWPLSMLVDGQALNITAVSNGGALNIGVVACQAAVPDAAPIARGISRSFSELCRALDLPEAGEALVDNATGSAFGVEVEKPRPAKKRRARRSRG